MMTKYAYIAAGAIALAGFATEAPATVRYTLAVDRDIWTGSSITAVYEAADFIRNGVSAAPDSCTASEAYICDTLELGFAPSTTVSYDGSPSVPVSFLGYYYDSAFGGFTFEIGAFAKTGLWQGGEAGFGTGASLLVEEISDTAAVPEPATWATMLIGFGAAGAVLRRRRIRFAAAVA